MAILFIEAFERALRSLQYAINQNGALLLGPSESLSALTQGLEPISGRHKLFRRIGNMAMPFLDRTVVGAPSPLTGVKPIASTRGMPGRRTNSLNVADAGVATLLNEFAPPAIVVNHEHETLHLYGDVNQFLLTREGIASLNIERMLPDRLVPIASVLLYKADRDRCKIVSDLVDLPRDDGEPRKIRLSAHPVTCEGEERLTMLCFQDETAQHGSELEPVNVDAETVARINILERELAATRESLQATIEELETSNEELMATNEELMASNEELQSSNEELQSVNEEMSTVNAEFQEKMLLLNRLNADLDSMARAAGVAMVFIDARLLITRYSPDAAKIFKLRPSDLERPLDDISHTLQYPDLTTDLKATLRNEQVIERDVTSLDGSKIYLVRILPYLIPSATESGAVATFVDVTAFHDAKRLQSVIDALPEHIAVVDKVGVIVMVNAAWRRFAELNGDEELKHSGPGANYLDVCQVSSHEDGSIAAMAANGLQGVLAGTLPVFSLQYPCHSPTEERWFVMNVAPVGRQDFGAVISHVNITVWKQSPESTP